jgi:hypothetical protein
MRAFPVDWKRGSKYHVAPAAARTLDGIRFDSKAEMARYQELLLLERTGHIANLERQPEYVLVEPFVAAGVKYRGIKYRGDFRYIEGGRTVVEEVKGVCTEAYKIKRQLFALRFPWVEFRELRLSSHTR